MVPLDLEASIPPGTSLVVDTSVVLAYLTATEPTSPVATELFDRLVSSGRNRAALSMVTVGEILVRPFRAGSAAVATAEGFLRHFADIRLIGVDYGIAREAARIRASSGLRTPDALIIATAFAIGADLLVTSDRSWPSVVDGLAAASPPSGSVPTLGLRVLLLTVDGARPGPKAGRVT